MPAGNKNNSHGNSLIWLSIILLVVFIACMVMAFAYTSSEARKAQNYLTTLSDQALLSQQLATNTSQSILLDGKKAFTYIETLRDQFEENLNKLESLESELGSHHTAELSLLKSEWTEYREKIDMILFGQKIIAETREHVAQINKAIPELEEQSELITDSLLKEDFNAKQIAIVSRQSMLIQRIHNNLNHVLSGDKQIETAADQFAKDAKAFGYVINSLLLGDTQRDIEPAKRTDSKRVIQEVSGQFRDISEKVSAIMDVVPVLNKLSGASLSIETRSRALLRTILGLKEKINERDHSNGLYKLVGYAFGLAALFTAVFLGYRLFKETRKSLKKSSEQHENQQAAIVQLLDEMSTLAEGDLTIRATVSETITGAIADSVNYAVEALRDLVIKINNTSGKLTDYANQADKTVQTLSEAANRQDTDITEATQSIAKMSESIHKVSLNASSSAIVARKSLDISHAGATKVRNTIEGMDAIREQMQATSKRIKRLSESSQEISNIVHLMGDIAEQTNVLALNAAIQASSGSSLNNQNFSGLADEVQQLARDAAESTRKIEVLVKAILSDTEEAVASMEVTTANVVEGAHNAETAKHALDEIESVSSQLAGLISNISETSRDQSNVAERISSKMADIQQITRKTSEHVKETSGFIGQLTHTAAELRESIYGFVLPK